MTAPYLDHIHSFSVTGLATRTNNRNEQDEDTANIASLWQLFFYENIYGSVIGQVEHSPIYGVYTEYASDQHDDFTVLVGVATVNNTETDYMQVNIEAGAYLVFDAVGEMPNAIIETWGRIWTYFETHPQTHSQQRAFKTDFEVYLSQTEAKVYIGVNNDA